MARILPIGCEYECQFPMSRNDSRMMVTVWRYRVVGHVSPEGESLCEIIDPVSSRERRVLNLRLDGADAFGAPIWRCEYGGDDPSPTYAEQLAEFGKESFVDTPQAEVDLNQEALRKERNSRRAADV